MCFVTFFIALDIFFLIVMAYDRFAAICHLLHYTPPSLHMKPWVCGLLVLVSWVISALHSLLESLLVLQLSFCPVLEVPHFFCELNQMSQLANSDTFLNNMVMYFIAVFLAGGSLFGIFYSYSKIGSSKHGISSAQGKYKAFSTHASHLLIVPYFIRQV